MLGFAEGEADRQMLGRLIKFSIGLAAGFFLGVALRSTRSPGVAEDA